MRVKQRDEWRRNITVKRVGLICAIKTTRAMSVVGKGMFRILCGTSRVGLMKLVFVHLLLVDELFVMMKWTLD